MATEVVVVVVGGGGGRRGGGGEEGVCAWPVGLSVCSSVGLSVCVCACVSVCVLRVACCVLCGGAGVWCVVVVMVVVRTLCYTRESVLPRALTHLIGRQNTWEQAPGVPATPSPP